MKNLLLLRNFALIVSMMLLTSCELVEGIFKAGFWVGILVVVGIVALILWLVRKAR